MRAVLLAAALACCLRSAAAAPAPDAVADGITRGARWMAAFPASDLQFDAAVILTGIRRLSDGPELRAAFEHARHVADADADHPHRRFWNRTVVLPPEQTSRWRVPRWGEARVATNRVIDEAIHCAHNGWRRATLRYLCGPMRDGGGYHSTHALWALVIARDEGCDGGDKSARCAALLAREIAAAQPLALRPTRTLDVDLYAERLLVSSLTGSRAPVLGTWAAALLERQDTDGSWGVRVPDEPPYHRYHATGIAVWALASWANSDVGPVLPNPK